jgi:bifunctional non-homologous end joining protein LigD
MPKDRLAAYRAKRRAGATPEPFASGGERPGMFVVQQHAARRRHYDLRLEIGGVMVSWAVPKGPSLDPTEKRLAVATEDHPLEYGDFEGVIPADNYGAGAVIIWDRGRCVHELEPARGLIDGKLLFELQGYKLRGLWTLVKTSRDPKEWLLIKKPDGAASGLDAEQLPPTSVFSGLTVEELSAGNSRAADLRDQLDQLGARRRRLRADQVKLTLARLERRAFSRPGWLFELKYDGYRLLAGKQGAGGGTAARRQGEVALLYRSGLDATALYPEIARTLRALPYDGLVIDGEAVVLDSEARPDFHRLQQRARLRRRPDIERATIDHPVLLYAFDLLGFEGYDLRNLPLHERKRVLEQVLPAAGPIRYADHIVEHGQQLFERARAVGLEGIVAKKANSTYKGGRGGQWLKIRAERSGDFVIVGWTRPKIGRPGFGALHLAQYEETPHEGKKLFYVGRVGSGFGAATLNEIRARLEPLRRATPAFADPVPAGKEQVWTDPVLVAEVRFTEITAGGQLRHPVFERLRDDKPAEQCLGERPPSELPPEPPTQAEPAAPRVELTRLGKVFWPTEGYTKGDLIDYYRMAAPVLLPYLRDRPLVLDRYPDGIDGKSFFQKNAPEFAPEWVRTEPVWSEASDKETRYFVCDDEPALVYLANSAAIPLHVWGSRIGSPQAPDWSILDLDAKDTPFVAAVEVAKAIRRLCRSIELPCYVKTSGASGLHVLIPLGGQCTFAQSKQLAMLLAQIVARQLPEQASVARSPSARQGKIYIDALQNGYGKLLVAPYSVRPLAGATVSMPLNWREVSARLDPRRFTIATAAARIKRWQGDPMAEVLERRPDLVTALGRLLAMQA